MLWGGSWVCLGHGNNGWPVFVPRQSTGSGGPALLSSPLWLAFQQSSEHRLVFTEIRHGMLGGVFMVFPPSLLAGFAAMQVSEGVTHHDQRCSGGLGLDICAFVYYLLLSLVLSKIT